MSIPRFASLPELLRWRVEQHPDRPLYGFWRDAQTCFSGLTYAELQIRATGLAHRLRSEHGRTGSRVLLLYPYGDGFPVAFMGCLMAGMVAIPAYPPDPGKPNQGMGRISTIVRRARPDIILTETSVMDCATIARAQSPCPERVRVVTTDDLDLTEHSNRAIDAPDGRSAAFIQFTSGTTGDPRGALISHRNLIRHQELAHPIFRCREKSTTVSWLPFYHDMGLIGPVLYPLYCGGNTAFLPPMAFVRRPLQWLELISRLRAQVSTAPNFAYDLCVKKAERADLAEIDLTCWQLTVCGAEPLKRATLDGFVRTFGPRGFKATTFMPCYGLAEATLMVSGAPLEAEPHRVDFAAEDLRLGRAEPWKPDMPTTARQRPYPMIGCGQPMQHHEVAIVHRHSGRRLAENEVGDIWIAGPSVSGGYVGQPQPSRESNDAQKPRVDESFVSTGDTGFVHAGQLFVCGRRRDEIELSGRIHQPHDIEEDVSREFGRLLAGSVVAVHDERGAVCLIVEVRRRASVTELDSAAASAVELVQRSHGLSVDRILFVRARSIEKTSSGKVRRHAYAAALRESTFDTVHHWREGSRDCSLDSH